MDSEYVTYTTREIIEVQLRKSIRFYIDQLDYLTALSLAGAAEEILGAILRNSGEKPSIQKKFESFKTVEESIWGKPALTKKEYIDSKNNTRNYLKHDSKHESITFNPELESRKMIGRALENYRNLYGNDFELRNEFVDEWKKKF
ncbi:MAG: hypothetical protein ACI9SP_004823 [Arenicella sp.]|jgi:hypothetical protein